MAEQTCNSSTREAEARGSGTPGQPGIHSETLSQNTRKNKRSKQKRNIV
jgi:hypothetical protein